MSSRVVIALASVLAAKFITAPQVAGAQGKSNESPIAASRFGISIDGVSKPKEKGLKSSSGNKGSGAKSYKLENAWPKKGN